MRPLVNFRVDLFGLKSSFSKTFVDVSIILVYDYYALQGSDYSWLEGVVGLAPSASNGTELFVDVLKRQKIIDRAVFSIDYRLINSKYAMTFGGIDTDRVPYLDNFTFADLIDDNTWTVGISSMKYDDLEFGGQAVKGYLDTNDNDLWLPPEDYKRWMNHTTYQKSCNKYGQHYQCVCSNASDGTISPIYITIGGYQYKMKPVNYIQIYYDSRERSTYCILLVRQSEDPSNSTVVLGQPFLKNFNIYYDTENKQIGIYGEDTTYAGSGGTYSGSTSSGSTKNGGTNSGGENTSGESGFIGIMISKLLGIFTAPDLKTGILIFSLIFNLFFLCFCCICCIGYRRKDGEDDEEQPLLYKKIDSG